MKRTFSFCILAIFLISLVTIPGFSFNNNEGQKAKSDPEAIKILDKTIKAQGGRKLLENITDSSVSGSMELTQMGMSGSLTMYQKEPNMMRLDIEIMGMVITQAFDGTTAWMVNPQTGSTEEMPEQAAEDMARQSLGNDSLLHPEKYGITYSYKGTEKFDGKDCLVLEQTYSDGHTATIYIDSKTYLTYKSKTTTVNQMGVEVEAESIMSDYRKVEGIMTAHSLITYQDGEEFMNMTVTEVKFNTGLEDSFFKMTE
ncbi:MAG: outer membrane lipoprotein-sorting protein [Acidobacteriota bacterium]|nr:outer membrane lipoprotein-sorting protein [Acidobacteriota bacterium]